MQTLVVYIHEILPREFVVSVFLGVGGGEWWDFNICSCLKKRYHVWSCVEAGAYYPEPSSPIQAL